jgi:hypothetical protein
MDAELSGQLPDRPPLTVGSDELLDLCLAQTVLALSGTLQPAPGSLR